MLSKEEVRANRDKLRRAIKVDVVEAMVEPRLSVEKSSEEASPMKKLQRK